MTAFLPLSRLAHTRLFSGRGGTGASSGVGREMRNKLSTTCCGVRTRLAGFAQSKAAEVPWWAWFGGLLSIVSTMAGLMLAEKMGSMFFTATTVTCSMVCSVLLDHFGCQGSGGAPRTH